jgi:ATP-dependent Clp protease ATP-binding subunit ClpC
MDSNSFNFNLKETKTFEALKWSPIFETIKFLKRIFLILFFLSFLFFIFHFLNFGFSLIFFVLSSISIYIEKFFEIKLKNPIIPKGFSLDDLISHPENYNLANFFSFEAIKAINQAIEFSKKRKLNEINSSAILYFCLKEGENLDFIFSRALLNLEEMKKELKDFIFSLKGEEFQEIFSEDSKKVIFEAIKIAQKKEKKVVEINDILVAQSKIDPIFKKHLMDVDLKPDDVGNLVHWQEALKERIEKRKKFWEWENLIKLGSIGKNWAAGYTITLDQYSTDWTEVIKRRGFEEIIGHKQALEHLERVLAREELHNALLVGEPGSGRKSLIHALAKKVLFGQSLPEINYKRIVELDVVSVLASSQSAEEVAAILERIFNEAALAGNVILVIDEFYNFVTQPKGALGVVDISGILARYLPLKTFRLIGITSYYGLHLFVEKNPAILNLMEKVEVKELSEEETILILGDRALQMENKYKKIIPYQTIKSIVKYSSRYITDFPFPKKAIDLLEGVMVYTLRYGKYPVVLPEYVTKVVSEITDIPLGEIEIKEREVLLNLENLIHKRIIDQEEAIKEISAALRRARSGVAIRKGPMGSFLFLGPTGVGKTETAKALAEFYFGSEKRMIRLDMSEFQNLSDIPRLIGSVEMEGLLTTRVKENPFTLVLLDEFEKAHPNILNLFLQVFDEGWITDGLGRKIDFTNTIIIATSNAGYQIILEALKEKIEWQRVKEKLLDFIFKKGIFRPELINRFDGVIVFKPLSKDDLLNIAELLLKKLKKLLSEKEIEFIITDRLKEKIVQLSFTPEFGARQMERVVQDKVGNPLAFALLSGKIKKGDKIEVDPEDFSIKIIT